MMSPGPPPAPVYPPLSPSVPSPRIFEPSNSVYTQQQLPIIPHMMFAAPPPSTPRLPGPVLAPLAIPGDGSSTFLRQYSVPTLQQPPCHVPAAHRVAPRGRSPGQLSYQQHHSFPPTPPAYEGRRVSNLDRLLPSQSTFNSPVSSSFSSPRIFDRRFSSETEQERRGSALTTVLPSPTVSIRRPSDDGYPEDTSQSYSSRYTPASMEESFSGSDVIARTSPGRYRIEVRQQPVAARACGFGERDRRVIDPPPIVQLIPNDPNSDPDELRYPFNVVHCTLWSVDGSTDETALSGVDKRLTRRLMGTLVSSPFVGVDEDNSIGCFFCFPDLSCRTHGKYRLRFVLMRLEPSDLQPEGYSPIITEAMSDIFTVYTAKEFPGMRPSTALTKALKRQGCAISVKKGNEKTAGHAADSGKDDGSGDEESGGGGKAKRRRRT